MSAKKNKKKKKEGNTRETIKSKISEIEVENALKIARNNVVRDQRGNERETETERE